MRILKLKVGVVSVAVKQQRVSRLQDSQSVVDLEMVVCNVVSAFSRDDALESYSFRQDESCGQHPFWFGAVRLPCHIVASARAICVMLVLTLTLIHAVLVGLCCGSERACFQVEGQAHLKRWQGRSDRGFADTELVMFEVAMECHGNRFRGNLLQRNSDAAARRHERMHDRVVEDIKHDDHWCKG